MTNGKNGQSMVFVLLFSGLVLGLGWAIRGIFGHEWGASWAGSLGALAVVVAVNRADWLHRAPIIAALGGVGWGVGGMMSYGLMVASGRGTAFDSVAYGYAMLIVIGGLYGFIGGGLFGLGLEASTRKTPWHTLVTEMVAFSYLTYAVLVGMLGWKMTPPRGENWAICLGAALALGWFLYRGGHHRALRTAAYAALGAGVGFSTGNLVQTLCLVLEIPVNGWNIMEFMLGFGGGVGMAYAVLSRDWEVTPAPSPVLYGCALVFLAAIIPLVNRGAAFPEKVFMATAEHLNMTDPAAFAASQQAQASVVVAIMLALIAGFACWMLRRTDTDWVWLARGLLLLHAFHFVALGAVKSSIFYTPFAWLNTRLWYFPAFVLLVLFWAAFGRKTYTLPVIDPVPERPRRWALVLAAVVLLPLLIALIAINTHDVPFEPYYERFGIVEDI